MRKPGVKEHWRPSVSLQRDLPRRLGEILSPKVRCLVFKVHSCCRNGEQTTGHEWKQGA